MRKCTELVTYAVLSSAHTEHILSGFLHGKRMHATSDHGIIMARLSCKSRTGVMACLHALGVASADSTELPLNTG